MQIISTVKTKARERNIILNEELKMLHKQSKLICALKVKIYELCFLKRKVLHFQLIKYYFAFPIHRKQRKFDIF